MKDLDISKIPVKFVRLWWLSKIKGYDKLIISEEQVPIFSYEYTNGVQAWDMYRDHWILVKCKIESVYNNKYLTEEYKNSLKGVSIRDYLRNRHELHSL